MATVFFALYPTRITRDETGLFQGRSKIRIEQHERSRDAMTNGTCLA
jgi:hypothetical protein